MTSGARGNDFPGRSVGLLSQAGEPYSCAGRARAAQLVLGTLAVFTTLDAGVIALLIEPIKKELLLTDLQVGLVNTTAFYCAYGALSVPMGLLADRCNRTTLLLGATVLWCAGLVTVGLSYTLSLLVAGKVILGAASAITYPAAMSLYSDYFPPPQRARAISTYVLGQVLGQAGATLLGGLGYSALARAFAVNPHALFGLTPWRALFLLAAILGMVLVPWVAMMKEPARSESLGSSAGTLRQLWSFRVVLIPIFAGMMFLTCASMGVLSWLPPALMRLYGEQPADFAVWLGAVQLTAGLVGAGAAGQLVELARKRGGRDRLMWPAALAAMFCAPASLMALAPGVSMLVLGLSVFTLSGAIAITIPVIAINFRIPNELRGLAMGLNVILIAIAGAPSAPIVAMVSAALGGDLMLGRAMALVGAPCAALAGLCFWISSQARGSLATRPANALIAVPGTERK